MLTRDNIESFLDRLGAEGVTYTEIQPNLWRIQPGGAMDFDVVCNYSPPVVLLRVKVMELPAEEAPSAALTRRLLELNASELVHGSYGIEGNAVVLTEALELSHLDYEEFLASYESMTLALAQHLREFASFREAR